MKIIRYVLYFVLVVLFLDLFGFVSWSLSNQKPDDEFYAGKITASIIKALKD